MNFSEKYIASIMDEDSDVDSHGSAIFWKAGSGSALKSKFMSLEAQNEAMEGRRRSQWRRGGSK
jgi:hypothetical protein